MEEVPEEAQPEPIPTPVVEEAKEEPVVEEKRIDEEAASQPVFEVAQEETPVEEQQAEELVAQEEQPASKEESPKGGNKKKKKTGLIIGLAIGGVALLAGIAVGVIVPISLAKGNSNEEKKADSYTTAYSEPLLSKDGKTVQYGLYPQTNVNDSSLISKLEQIETTTGNGWYLLNGIYYAKLTASPAKSGNTFNNGNEIVLGTAYWFKCEPVKWRVISHDQKNNRYYLVSDMLLDASAYSGPQASSNNYQDSSVRSWLTSEFYTKAFRNKTSILTTVVDNSADSTDSPTNPYTCSNTNDKVYLPSYKAYNDLDYGFSTLHSRLCKTTDYARANGSFCVMDAGDYKYNGYYWTRSPYSGSATVAWSVDYEGSMSSSGFVGYIDVSVRPAMTIKIE